MRTCVTRPYGARRPVALRSLRACGRTLAVTDIKSFTLLCETLATAEAARRTIDADGVTINGVDIIRFDAEDRITHFKVMVRPLKAINLLHRLMGEQLAKP